MLAHQKAGPELRGEDVQQSLPALGQGQPAERTGRFRAVCHHVRPLGVRPPHGEELHSSAKSAAGAAGAKYGEAFR
ncbi:hypothetical protein GCM10010129_06640 [Streptomyces fumigatiscleroticus]|nr:hypothetical protein GCM10010129_06640 [Streptomyces fumigatiscleroticus]